VATNEPTNPTPASQTKPADLAALAARLAAHAEGIENIAAQAMANGMAAASGTIERLIAGIRQAAAETTDAATQRALAALLGDPAEPK